MTILFDISHPAHVQFLKRMTSLGVKAALVGIVVLAAAVRLYHLGHESIWFDEATSIRNATEGVAYTVRHRAKTLHPPLYGVLLCGVVAVAGSSEAAVRFPSAVFGVLACYWVYLLGKEFAGGRVGLLAGLLLALGYYPVRYSQEARMYSMLMALTVASVLLMWSALRGEKVRTWIAFCLVNVLLGYTHVFGLLVIAVENMYFLYAWLGTRRGGKAWLAVQGATAAALLPWVLMLMVPQAAAITRSGTSLKPPTLGTVWRTMRCFFPLHPRQEAAEYISVPYALVAALGLVWVARRRSPQEGTSAASAAGPDRGGRPGSAPVGVLLALWLLAPFAITLAVSKLLGPCYVARCLIVAAPPMSLLLALGISALGKYLRAIMVLGICGLALVGLKRYYRKPTKEQWRKVAHHIQENRCDGDCVVICSSSCVRPFNYYCRESQQVLPRHLISRDLGAHELHAQLPGLLAGKLRVCLVLSHERDSPLRAVLERAPWARRLRRRIRAKGIDLYLYKLDFADAPGRGRVPGANPPETAVSASESARPQGSD